MILADFLLLNFLFIRFYNQSYNFCAKQIEYYILKKYGILCNIKIRYVYGNPPINWIETNNINVKKLLNCCGKRVCKLKPL